MEDKDFWLDIERQIDIDMEDKDFWLDIERQIEEGLEACRNCAYSDCGSCSCYERHSIECPYAEEEEGD